MNGAAGADRDVVIAGAGPVGLFLACRLGRAGISTVVVEKRREPVLQSRSIGIHPPSLERLAELSLAERFVESGVRVTVGRAYADGRRLGSISFAGCPKPYGFALSLPQPETERILGEALAQTPSVQVRRGYEVRAVAEEAGGLLVTAAGADGEQLAIPCRFAVGCDGMASRVRQSAGIAFHGGAYPDSFSMGDFADRTDFGSEARVFVGKDGLVESFPLPGSQRRWVLATDQLATEPDVERFAHAIHERTGHRLDASPVHGLSAFRVHAFLAERLYLGRVILAGDAAHVVSPIGGQGMNLGWLNAWDVAAALVRILHHGCDQDAALAAYQRRARRRALRTRRRAELNMALGRRARWPALRHAFLRVLLGTPARGVLARLWTMRWL